MKHLIVYMSHHGTTEKAAMELAGHLGIESATVVNLARSPVPDLEPFDTVLVGGSIHAGSIQQKIRKFCELHAPRLLQKRLGLFLCFMDQEKGQQEFDLAFPENLRKHAIASGLFGGEFLFEKMNFLEKVVVKKVGGVRETTHKLNHEAIAEFAKQVNATSVPERVMA